MSPHPPRPGLERPWTPSQLAAIAARTRTLVSAAAGSGKTSVLVERVVRSLLGDGGAHQPPESDPRGVLAVTFTRKAAAEMRERIAHELHAAEELELLGQLELATIGTIHSLCGAVLREHGAAIGIDPGYVLLEDSQDSWYAQLTFDELLAAPPTDDVTWLLQRAGAERTLSCIDALRQVASRIPDGELRFADTQAVLGNTAAKVLELDARRATIALGELWRAFDAGFRVRLEAAGAMTFDDLERHALRAVQVPQVATALRERWQLVAIDEFQDTNERQLRILDAIAGESLFMVGDQWQSIYRFRGADIAVFQRELTSPDTAKVFMLENFRSDAPVLDVVNAVFGHDALFGADYEAVIAGSDRQRAVVGPQVELLLVGHRADREDAIELESDAPREREARRVAERVAELVTEGVAPGDIVLVYETSTHLERFEAALRELGVPTLRAASTGYYDQLDVRDVLTVLRVVRNPLDDLAVAAFLSGPFARLGYGELAELLHAAGIRRGEGSRTKDPERRSLLELAMASGDPRLVHAASVVEELRQVEQRESVVEVVERIVAAPEFELAAAADVDGIQRLANLRHLVSLAVAARRVGVGDAARFLDYVDAQRRFQGLGDASVADETSGAVRLMTIHASKGLEFPHVFYVKGDGVMGPTRPGDTPGPLLDEHGALHVAAPSESGPLRDTGAMALLRDAEVELHHRERMRKAYVAMTRAKTKLYVSAAVDRVAEDQACAESAAAGAPLISYVDAPVRWIRSTLAAWDHAVAAPTILDRVIVDGRAAAGRAERRSPHAAAPVSAPEPRCDVTRLFLDGEAEPEAPVAADPHALRQALTAAVASARDRERRLADGTRIHDALARLLDAAVHGELPREELLRPGREPWLTERTAARLAPVVATETFQRLVELRARPEVPWLASFGAIIPSAAAEGVRVVADADLVDAGRMDVLAVLPDGRWWIVDWKVSLDASSDDAWHEHGRQLSRYAVAAHRAGAPGSLVTLASLANEPVIHTWDSSSLGVAATRSRVPAPPRAGIPAPA